MVMIDDVNRNYGIYRAHLHSNLHCTHDCDPMECRIATLQLVLLLAFCFYFGSAQNDNSSNG